MSQALHDRIAELEAEVAALRFSRDAWKSGAELAGSQADRLQADLSALRQAAANNAARTSDLEARLRIYEPGESYKLEALRVADSLQAKGLLLEAQVMRELHSSEILLLRALDRGRAIREQKDSARTDF
jgi:hypothetical protein